MNLLDAISYYLKLGLRITPISRQTKNPRLKKWNERFAITASDFKADDNVGLLMGAPLQNVEACSDTDWRIYDVDIDTNNTAARAIVWALLPSTGWKFGRGTKPESHGLYVCTESVKGRRFKDINGKTSIEFRGLTSDGKCTQTVAPGSVHASGEPIEWCEPLGKIAQVNGNDLFETVRLAAVGLVVLDVWPKHERHDARLAFSRVLLEAGLGKDSVAAVLEAVMTTTGSDQKDAARAVRDTEKRLDNSEDAIGGGWIIEHLPRGRDTLKTIDKILDRDRQRLILHPGDPLKSAREFVGRGCTVDGVRAIQHQQGVFYRFNGSTYVESEDGTVRAEMYEFLDKASVFTPGKDGEEDRWDPFNPTPSKVEAVIDATRAITHLQATRKAPCWLADGPHLIAIDVLPCGNGLLYIPERRIIQPTPNFFSLNGLDYDFDQRAPQPDEWLKFLSSVWPDDQESINTLQEICGYYLTPDTKLQKIVMLIGPKRSGKGTIAKVLKLLVGERNYCSPTLHSFGRDYGKQVLINKTLAVISDARLSGRTDPAMVIEALLSISGVDSQTIARKFLPDWNGNLSVRFMLLTNELPRLSDPSGALVSRFVTLVMRKSFFGREDLSLFNRLAAEMPGILNWALDGRDRLYARGYLVQPATASTTEQQFSDLSNPVGAFLQEFCVEKPGAKVMHEHLFAQWVNWCRVNGHDFSGTSQTFARNLRAALPWIDSEQPRVNGRRPIVWLGLQLKSPADGKGGGNGPPPGQPRLEGVGELPEHMHDVRNYGDDEAEDNERRRAA